MSRLESFSFVQNCRRLDNGRHVSSTEAEVDAAYVGKRLRARKREHDRLFLHHTVSLLPRPPRSRLETFVPSCAYAAHTPRFSLLRSRLPPLQARHRPSVVAISIVRGAPANRCARPASQSCLSGRSHSDPVSVLSHGHAWCELNRSLRLLL